MMKRCVNIYVAALALLPLAAGSQVFEKNGAACIEQMCLGDSLEVLRGLQWDAVSGAGFATTPAAASQDTQPPALSRAVQSTYRAEDAALAAAQAYLQADMFDGAALALLEKVTAACGKHELRGNFVAVDGSPTRVGIALRPADKAFEQQRWQVVSIAQVLPAASSDVLRAEATARLRERYRAFNLTKVHSPQPGVSTFFITPTPDQYSYNLLMYRGLKEDAQLKRHPNCSGTTGAADNGAGAAAAAKAAVLVAVPRAAHSGPLAKTTKPVAASKAPKAAKGKKPAVGDKKPALPKKSAVGTGTPVSGKSMAKKAIRIAALVPEPRSKAPVKTIVRNRQATG